MADKEQSQGNVKIEYNSASTGLNMDQTLNQVKPGNLTYALNAALENFDSNSVNYQNEQGNEFCLQFPLGYSLIGTYFINEKNKHIFFLVNPNSGMSEIGYMDNNDCNYITLINATCLNFNIHYPINKVVHKISNCTTEIYWTDGYNSRRYMNINPEHLPWKLLPESSLCNPMYDVGNLDCNKIKVQPNFSIPELHVEKVISGGSLKAGTVQFAVQYSDVSGNGYTSYYSVTNPCPIADIHITDFNFDYEIGKSVVLNISNLDVTGEFRYFNLAVITTVNASVSVSLVGTYSIENPTKNITYTGEDVTAVILNLGDILEKHPYYEIAQDLTVVQDVLIWDNLTSIDRINYQDIASQIKLKWQTYKVPPTENYANEANATNLKGYLRDEIYALEIVFLLKNGKQTDGFHIPGRELNYIDLQYPEIPTTNADFIGEPDRVDLITGIGYSPYWKIYNTSSVIGVGNGNKIGNATPHEYGEFAYWESEETYPCNQSVWGNLSGQKIRHHKFPDILVSPSYESAIPQIKNNKYIVSMQNDSIYPLGIKIDSSQIKLAINNSNLTDEQKYNIVGFKVIRGDRATNKSIIAKGILRNVGEYTREEQTYYYPNYPYNDLEADPFINQTNNAWLQEAKPWIIYCYRGVKDQPNVIPTYTYTNLETGKPTTKEIIVGTTIEMCSATRPFSNYPNTIYVGPASYDVWHLESSGCGGYRVEYNDPFTNNNSLYKFNDPWLNGSGLFDVNSNVGDINTRVNIDDVPLDLCSNSSFDICPCYSNKNKQPSITSAPGIIDFGPNGSFFSPTVGRISTMLCGVETPINSFNKNSSLKYRQVFNSPETSFGQPFLGNILKLENVMYGAGKAHHVEVKNNAKYRLLSKEAQQDALVSCYNIASLTTDVFNSVAMYTAYQTYLQIFINGILRKNFGYSYNSIANYDYFANIDNNVTVGNTTGIKQRELDLKQYLIPVVQSVGEPGGIGVNNYQRETSVYLKTVEKRNNIIVDPLLFPSDTPSLLNGNDSYIQDKSRYTITEAGNCNSPEKQKDISVVSYYASIKNVVTNQWGQIYSYQTIDTGAQQIFDSVNYQTTFTAFGGDTTISRYSFKTKLPFFIDNRVNSPDDSEVFYDELGNIGYPKYWHSSRSILYDFIKNTHNFKNIISVKAHNFDCATDPALISGDVDGIAGTYRTYYSGDFYMFAYGQPNFYCESSYNTDLRQAFNNKEGEFWPHVTTGIPDDWVQETFVPITFDNTYHYNPTYSKQNKENYFSHLPPDWETKLCFTNYPFRAIYSDAQEQNADIRVNNWLNYAPTALFDFPQNYGNLVSLDGIQNKAILARFENKSLLYNALLTMDSSNPKAAYLGGAQLFGTTPPIDFAETDLGYIGSQNKFLLKIPQGQITIDAKRGQIFLIEGTKVEEIGGFGSGVNRFMTDHLSFEISRYFPDYQKTIDGQTIIIPGVNVDNHFNGIGLHGVYDSKFERIIITKLDYIPVDKDVKYDTITKEFYIETIVYTTNPTTLV